MYLFFDTETTGLPINYKAPAENINNWPRIVSISWLLQKSENEAIASGDYVIKPDGYLIPDAVAAIHGITTKKALEIGVPILSALGEFEMCAEKAHTIVSHNVTFDKPIVQAEFLRANMPNSSHKLGIKNSVCTKLSTTKFCKLPGKYGYKWPKLKELYTILFGYEFENQHNSMSDVHAMVRCFWELKKRGVI